MNSFLRPTLFLSGLMLVSASSVADSQDEALASAREAIKRSIPELKVEDINPTPAPGLFEVVSGGHMGYATPDGKFVVSGDLIDVTTGVNLSEERRNGVRLELLSQIAKSDEIVFSPAEKPRHYVTVFTDVDCGYCRKLHSEIAAINAQGIEVRYIAYPRSGPASETWSKMEAVWCSADRQEAITQAKLGKEVEAEACKTPIAEQYALGEKLGVRGTPTMVTDRGELIPGYLPPAALAERLDQMQQAKAQVAQGG